MVREAVIVQMGQCGNQIGRRFWAEQLNEAVVCGRAHGSFFDSAMSALFRNLDVRYAPAVELTMGSALSTLRARALMIDTEQGVVSQTMRDPIVGDLFEETQLITDTGGAGNNWAHGYMVHGCRLSDNIEEATRLILEADSPQAFIFLHSICGGTGSGLGSFVLEQLRDSFPELCRLNITVFPSGKDEDVITAPYNAVLSTQKLTQVSDSVVPLDNSAMLKYCSRYTHVEPSPLAKQPCGFDEVNDVAAQFLSHLMAGARYNGDLNVDVNEISTNLVPFQQLKYLTASFAPLCSTGPAAEGQHHK
jgi:tubulin epsilon